MTTPFDSLTQPEQRRAIARDALAQIEAGSLTPKEGVYMVLPPRPIATTDSLRQLYREAQSSGGCPACALGAILASQLNLNGDCLVGDLNTGVDWPTGGTRVYVGRARYGLSDLAQAEVGGFYPFILRYFAPDQLQTIEIAFELGRGACEVSRGLLAEGTDGAREWASVAHDEMVLITREQAAAAVAFGKCFETARSRIIAIMESISAHPDGLFVP